jgi:hypothetical protein
MHHLEILRGLIPLTLKLSDVIIESSAFGQNEDTVAALGCDPQ